MSCKRRAFSFVELIIVLLVLLLFFWTFSQFSAKSKIPTNRQKCANNLKNIGIASLLYSNDYRQFPYFPSLQSIDPSDIEKREKPAIKNDPERVFKALFDFNYLFDPAQLICPDSGDSQSSAFQQSLKARSPIKIPTPWRAPINNPNLSYTVINKPVEHSSAKSGAVVFADQDYRPSQKSLETAISPGKGHRDGFNVVHVDGHVSFLPIQNKTAIEHMVKSLIFDDTNVKAQFSSGK